jgi:hypothetical protein
MELAKIKAVHEDLNRAIDEVLARHGFKLDRDPVKYGDTYFRMNLEASLIGEMSRKEKQDSEGLGNDKNGEMLVAGDVVENENGARFEVIGFKRIKILVKDAGGKKLIGAPGCWKKIEKPKTT